jgi:hypothetical protein
MMVSFSQSSVTTRSNGRRKKGKAMPKKIILLLAAVAILASAVPAFARATTGLTESGVLVSPGNKVDAKNIGAVVLTSTKLGATTCDFWTLTGEVEKNTTATVRIVQGAFSANNIAKECMTSNGTAFTVKNLSIRELHTEGTEISGGLKEGKFSLILELIVGTLTCKFSTASSPFDYKAGTDEMTMSGSKLEVTPAACGASATLDGKFTITTDNSPTFTPLILD